MAYHNFNLKMIKIMLVVLVFLTVITMISGMNLLKNNYYFNGRFLSWEINYMKTELLWLSSNASLSFWPFQKSRPFPVVNNQAKAKLIPILVYHGVITDSKWQPDEVNVGTRDFRSQMFALKKDGWQTISVEDYRDFIQGKKQLPEKSFLLTFDDGRKDSYYGGDPILKVVGYKATMFVITGRSLGQDNEKNPFHLSELELQKMVANGRWEIGSHTQNGHGNVPIDINNNQGHFLSNMMWLASENRLETESEFTKRVTNDLIGSKKDIENKLGVKPLSFAYPYGDLGKNSSNLPGGEAQLSSIVKSIYSMAFIQAGNNDFISNSANDSFLSKRIGVDSLISADQLVQMLNSARYKSLNYLDNFTTDQGWLRGWGNLNFVNNKMLIGTSKTEDSASTFLSGSSLWKDYIFSAKINMTKGNSFELVGRYVDENNYMTCDFSGDQVSLTQKVAGQYKPRFETKLTNEIKAGVIEDAGIKLNGNSATCYLRGAPVVSGNMDSNLNYGGIGFKTWDSQGMGSEIQVMDLRINAIQ